MTTTRALFLALLCLAPTATAATPQGADLQWRDFGDEAFAEAKRDDKLILLGLEAVWCHWCHVMDARTYTDPEVVALLREHFVTIRVDQDARPDISNRYEDWGWPATILFDSNGRELAKLQGFVRPRRMASVLRAFVAEPTPGPSIREAPPVRWADSPHLDEEARRRLRAKERTQFDDRHAAWGRNHKFLQVLGIEYLLHRAREGATWAARDARRTLDAQRALIDPVWGGVYQYSDSGVWTNPHFEKLTLFQADNLRAYALGYEAFGRPEDLAAARAIERYLVDFMTDAETGAFFVSQDADVVAGEHAAGYFALDDAGRRAVGIPRIDRHLYARENGRVVEALAVLARVTGDQQTLARAVRAARWAVAHRRAADGTFEHGDADRGGPFLADSVAMLRGFEALSTLRPRGPWRTLAVETAMAIAARFTPIADPPGLRTRAVGAVEVTGSSNMSNFSPIVDRDENVAAARALHAVWKHTPRPEIARARDSARRWLVTPAVAFGFRAWEVLLVDAETRPR